jgi:prepilin-type processing-associated H-X9-DG protein
MELLVVLAIIGLLAGLGLPVITRAKESGRSTVCLSNLRQIGIGLQLYVQDNQNRLPYMRDAVGSTNSLARTNDQMLPSPDAVLSICVGSDRVFCCPSDRHDVFGQTGSSYGWNSLLNGQDADQFKIFDLVFNPHQIPVFFDKEAFHAGHSRKRGINFLYADGHIKNLLAAEDSP